MLRSSCRPLGRQERAQRWSWPSRRGGGAKCRPACKRASAPLDRTTRIPRASCPDDSRPMTAVSRVMAGNAALLVEELQPHAVRRWCILRRLFVAIGQEQRRWSSKLPFGLQPFPSSQGREDGVCRCDGGLRRVRDRSNQHAKSFLQVPASLQDPQNPPTQFIGLKLCEHSQHSEATLLRVFCSSRVTVF